MHRRTFLQAASGGLVVGGLLKTAPVFSRPMAATSRGRRRILCNDDGAIIYLEPPVTAGHLREMVRTYDGTIDVLCWCIGDREVYVHDTRVAEIFGSQHESFDDAQDWRVFQNSRAFIESGKCVLATLTEICHQEGVDLFPSVRMNSHYSVDPDSPHHSAFRLEHPEYLIAYPEGYQKGSKEYAVRMGLNYARPEVRQHMSDTIIELFERFDVDGVEMDFMRHPTFFKLHEAVENSFHLTHMLRRIKRRRDEVSRTTGRKIDLAARVPPTFADGLRVGIDSRTWIREGLVDLLIAGGGFIPFEMPFEEFVKEGRESPCQIYGSLELLRFMTGPTRDPRITRAIAQRYWKAGADGLHLFNYFAQASSWKQQLFREIADSRKLERLDKRYQVDTRRWRAGSWGSHGGAFSSAVPAVQLPVLLSEAEPGPALWLSISDDLEAAQTDGSLSKAFLRLQFDDLTSRDEMEVTLNGETLPDTSLSRSHLERFWNKNDYPDGGRFLEGTVEYRVERPPLRSGRNRVEVRVKKRNPKLRKPLVLSMVEVLLYYKG